MLLGFGLELGLVLVSEFGLGLVFVLGRGDSCLIIDNESVTECHGPCHFICTISLWRTILYALGLGLVLVLVSGLCRG